MKTLPRSEIRSEPIDIFYCLKCYVPVKTSSIDLFNKTFCQDCFDSKIDTNGTKVSSWGGWKYRVFRHQRKVVCSLCNCEYDLLTKEFTPQTLEEQKTRYEKFIIDRQKWNGIIDSFNPNPPPFIPVNYDEEVAPLGWTNELLCKKCFIVFYNSNYDEIQQENYDYDAQQVIRRKKEIIDYEITAANDKGLAIGMIIFFLLLLVVILDKCSFNNDDSPAPADIYHRR